MVVEDFVWLMIDPRSSTADRVGEEIEWVCEEVSRDERERETEIGFVTGRLSHNLHLEERQLRNRRISSVHPTNNSFDNGY